ncbi:inhibitor of Bruton tyrosine kinase-like isoform X2 [Notothenia coriiceps]|uniref:Inhibitor of Bruton tyrosine kinase-like isoform X2 n=1 Tax=Notothenia coriiceps TaxID=8208 RepID=A0A6I9PKF2_9TELE|nr:PREDICTED: inhibitor of Bruton tyrosine kinase-like isoform X2 [Notothenia coriiceps]
MERRVITPYPDAPDLSVYEDEGLDSAFSPKPEAELDHSCREILLKKAKIKAKKKPRRRSDSSGGYTLSNIIHSPPAAVVSPCLVKSGRANSTDSLQEMLTSDSEGSYVGDDKALRLKTPPSTPTSLMDSLLTPPPSAQQTIPKGLPCPTRPALVLDLRTIMDMQANSVQPLGATPKSPGSSVISSLKHSPVPAKLSQKQRKMLAMAYKEASVEPTTSQPTPTVTPSKSSVKAWATAAQSPPSLCSFRALLEEEQNRLVRVGQTGAKGGQGAPVSPISPVTAAPPATRRVTFK